MVESSVRVYGADTERITQCNWPERWLDPLTLCCLGWVGLCRQEVVESSIRQCLSVIQTVILGAAARGGWVLYRCVVLVELGCAGWRWLDPHKTKCLSAYLLELLSAAANEVVGASIVVLCWVALAGGC